MHQAISGRSVLKKSAAGIFQLLNELDTYIPRVATQAPQAQFLKYLLVSATFSSIMEKSSQT